MAIYGLFLKSHRCPDGVELVAGGELAGGPYFRARTDRREPMRLEIQNLENPVVVEFINAHSDDALAEFFLKFGPLVNTSQSSYTFSVLEDLRGWQKTFRAFLATVGSSNQVDALQAINELLPSGISRQPSVDLGGEGGAPRMLLECEALLDIYGLRDRNGRGTRRQVCNVRTLRQCLSHGAANRPTLTLKILQRSLPRRGDACTSQREGLIMSIRKRTWKSNAGEQTAWVVDYVDQLGGRRLKTFATKKEADAGSVTARHEVSQGIHTPGKRQHYGCGSSRNVDRPLVRPKNWSTVQSEQRRQHLILHIASFIGRERLSSRTTPHIYAFDAQLRDAGRSVEMRRKV